MSEIYDIEELSDRTFPIYFKLIDRYQRGNPILTEKLTCAEYQTGYFFSGQNTVKLVTYKDKLVIPQLLQKYPMEWYYTYILHPGMDTTEAIIHQHLYWKDIRNDVQKEVTGCDACKRTKRPTKKYGAFPAKPVEEKPWNKLCVDLTGPYNMSRKGK